MDNNKEAILNDPKFRLTEGQILRLKPVRQGKIVEDEYVTTYVHPKFGSLAEVRKAYFVQHPDLKPNGEGVRVQAARSLIEAREILRELRDNETGISYSEALDAYSAAQSLARMARSAASVLDKHRKMNSDVKAMFAKALADINATCELIAGEVTWSDLVRAEKALGAAEQENDDIV